MASTVKAKKRSEGGPSAGRIDSSLYVNLFKEATKSSKYSSRPKV